jgi:hypothetical protein
MLAFIEVELPNPKILSKLRNYLQKWRPLKQALPANELEALGIPRGPKFDKILDQLFDAQIRGRAKTPEDRTKLLKQFAGIKDEPKKPIEKEKKKKKGRDEHVAALTKPAPGAAAPAATPAPAHASNEPAAAPMQAAAKTAAKASKPAPHTAAKPAAAAQKSKQKATKKSRR